MEMGTMEMRMKNKVVILVMEIPTDLVTIHLMIMVLVTIMTMKTPMMMGISQTLLMLWQHQLVTSEVKEKVLEQRFESPTLSTERIRQNSGPFQFNYNSVSMIDRRPSERAEEKLTS